MPWRRTFTETTTVPEAVAATFSYRWGKDVTITHPLSSRGYRCKALRTLAFHGNVNALRRRTYLTPDYIHTICENI